MAEPLSIYIKNTDPPEEQMHTNNQEPVSLLTRITTHRTSATIFLNNRSQDVNITFTTGNVHLRVVSHRVHVAFDLYKENGLAHEG